MVLFVTIARQILELVLYFLLFNEEILIAPQKSYIAKVFKNINIIMIKFLQILETIL